MSSAATPIYDHDEIYDTSTVKVVFDKKFKALYFSRLPIPFNREKENLTPSTGNTLVFMDTGKNFY